MRLGKRVCKPIIFCALLLFFAMPTSSVYANPFAARARAAAVSQLTDQVMKTVQPRIAELCANAPVSQEFKAEIEQKLTEAAERIVKTQIDGAAGGSLPNPAQLADQVVGELRNIVSELVNAAAGGGAVVGTHQGAAGGTHPAAVAAAKPPSLMIVPPDLERQGGEADASDELRVLMQMLRAAIGNTGAYAVLPPRDAVARAVTSELKSQGHGHTPEDRAKAIGAATGANYVLLIESRTLGSLNMLLMQIYNAENGALLTGEILNYRAIEEAAEQLPGVAVKLTENAPRAVASTVVQTPAHETWEPAAPMLAVETTADANIAESTPVDTAFMNAQIKAWVEEQPLGRMKNGVSIGIRFGYGPALAFERIKNPYNQAAWYSERGYVVDDYDGFGLNYDLGVVINTRLSNRFALVSGLNVAFLMQSGDNRNDNRNEAAMSYLSNIEVEFTETALSIPLLVQWEIVNAGFNLKRGRMQVVRQYFQFGLSANMIVDSHYKWSVDGERVSDIEFKKRNDFYVAPIFGAGIYLTKNLLLDYNLAYPITGGGGFRMHVNIGGTYFVTRPR